MRKLRIVCILFVIAILFCLPSFATFEIGNFTIDAKVLSNGDMEVKETINYYTDETVNGLTRDIEIKNQYNTTNSADGITLQGVYVDGEAYQSVGYAEKGESGVYTYYTSSDGGSITLYSPFANEYKTVEYHYLLENVAVKYNDTAELFWNFIGSEWDCSIKNLAINITLPEAAAAETIWVYGHGSDYGTFTKSENFITLNVSNISPYQAVDSRILFSRNAIPEGTKVHSKSVLHDYINHEEGMSKELEAKKVLFGLSVKEVSFVLSLAILAIGIGIYIFFDKEERVEKVQYYRELPYGLDPEVLQYIYYGKVKSNAFYVGMLNLIKLGVYKLENTVNKVGKETQKIIYNPNHNVVLKEYQKRMVTSVNGFLEDEGNDIKSIDLLKLSTKMEKSSGTGYRMFIKDIEAEKEGLLGKPSKAPKRIVFFAALTLIAMIAFITFMGIAVGGDEAFVIPMFLGFISFIYSIFFATVGNALPVMLFLIFHMGCFHGGIIAMLVSMGIGWLYIPYLLTFILIQYIIRIKKYPKEERQIVEYIKGLKRYISHYSMLDEKDGVMENLALWEDYFIIAIALGLNNKTVNYFYDYGKVQHSNLGDSMRCVVSYRAFSYGISTPFHNYSRGHIVSSGGSYSSSYGGSSHSGSSGGFSGGSSSGGGGGRRRWR